MTQTFDVLLEWDAESQMWVTFVPALGEISTFGASREEALEATREAIQGYLEAAAKEGLPVPPGGPFAARDRAHEGRKYRPETTTTGLSRS